MSQLILRIATRKSPLALWQANYTADRLRHLPAQPTVELVPIVTSGDTNQTDALRQFGGTGVFTREVQKAVLDGRADLAVHSLKDLPTDLPEGLILGAVEPREDPRDVLVHRIPGGSARGCRACCRALVRDGHTHIHYSLVTCVSINPTIVCGRFTLCAGHG